MKRLFIFFLVVVMLVGCGCRSIVKHDIEGQDVYIPQQVAEKTDSVRDSVYRYRANVGTGVFAVGLALMAVYFLKEPGSKKLFSCDSILAAGGIGSMVAGILILPRPESWSKAHKNALK